jgi:hypothetical protein
MAEEPEPRWWSNPQGILSMATIFTLVVGFFWVREKQMWENSNRIANVETRGDKALISVNTRFERLETLLGELKDRENFLERKIDRLEVKDEELEQKIKGWQQPYQ